MAKKIVKGFSLIELMIVIVIVAILALIVYPSYTHYVMKSRRTDALSALTEDQQILERCYAQNYSYSAACSALPSFPQASQEGYYSINISNLSSSTFTLTATPVGTQVNDTTCASISVDQNNTKTAVDTSGQSQSSCWSM